MGGMRVELNTTYSSRSGLSRLINAAKGVPTEEVSSVSMKSYARYVESKSTENGFTDWLVNQGCCEILHKVSDWYKVDGKYVLSGKRNKMFTQIVIISDTVRLQESGIGPDVYEYGCAVGSLNAYLHESDCRWDDIPEYIRSILYYVYNYCDLNKILRQYKDIQG